MKTDDKNILLLAGAMLMLSELEENHKWCTLDTTHAIAVSHADDKKPYYAVICSDCGESILELPLVGNEEHINELIKDVREMLTSIELPETYDKELTDKMEKKRQQEAAKELADKIKDDGLGDEFKEFLEDLFEQL